MQPALPPPRPSDQARPLRLSRLLTVALSALSALVVLTASTLVFTSSVMEQNTERLTTSLEAQRTARDIEGRLLSYDRRVGDMAERGENEPAAQSESTQRRLGELLAEAHSYVGSEIEQEVLQSLQGNIDSYFAARRRAAEAGLRLEDALDSARPTFDAALADADRLAVVNAADAASALQATRRWNFRAELTALASTVTLALVVAGLAVGARRKLYIPLLRLAQTIQRFGAGDTTARAENAGPVEIGTIARAFNEMADVVVSQRKQQLDFLAAVAHDLRNPLAAIKLSVATLGVRGALSGERTARTLSIVDRQVDRLGRMVDDLLDAARVEAGELTLHPSACDLRDIARDAVELYAPTTTRHELDVDIPDEPLAGLFDAARVHQVLDNLLSNAIKYSPVGGHVRLALRREGDDALMSVADEGVGIPPEELARLFEPFQRAPSGRKVAHGLGLGLWVVRRIVEAHGGHIRVESQPGEGSTFLIRLPLAARPAAEDDAVRCA
ncbi:sensor histidine kinase [Polyangium aurulentum]|uniref:sensor histidine kinase n=1 Tax=Polyangium aurulentum TaxID=2567896 RepID=UPI0010AED551|nr:HAMP domain-containing sensor histidine kinase [Polyangium aurulentum]UQA57879.1 HAMP domain-containing histidine kinase [Polyangium aurulentum]